MTAVHLSYLARSELVTSGDGATLSLSPNLARERVSFDGEVKDPVRFREAMSALHEVVVGDLRRPKKDRTAYLRWKKEESEREAKLLSQFASEAEKKESAKLGKKAPPPNLEQDFRRAHSQYWRARVDWANDLSRNDPLLFRHLVPCDPVITVAPDTVFFEAFSKDESSYGCLYVDRGAFSGASNVALGTTNVDYSNALYDHLQSLRTYRSTRLLLDPKGFEVQVLGRADHREEKIDLPGTWLRGFGQISAATALGGSLVTLPVELVYSMLAFLKRRREKTGPRSIRFRLVPGKPPEVVLDPWNEVLVSRGPAYEGPTRQEVKIWGRRRLLTLARTLPLADRVEVLLLGSGLPSIWVVRMGDMRFVLALSGWTTNDWTGSLALDLLAGNLRHDLRTMQRIEKHLVTERSATLDGLARATDAGRDLLLGSLVKLAKQGQVVFDYATSRYRYRSILPVPLAEASTGPESEEILEAERILAERAVQLERQEPAPSGRLLIVGKAAKTSCEAMLDADGRFVRARCSCSHFHRNGLRAGPCRHLFALRVAFDRQSSTSSDQLLH
ncbi:MAG: SWIM zinc finger family protein [Polyangiaceae bacterium]|nr:SWIM zinc finger family protein [Polyangiaceae bacterium]